MSLNVVVHDAGRLDVKFVGRDAGNEGILSIILLVPYIFEAVAGRAFGYPGHVTLHV